MTRPLPNARPARRIGTSHRLSEGASPMSRLQWVAVAVTAWRLAAAPAEASDSAPDPARIRDAVTRGAAVVARAAENYPKHRDCFSCHHQTLPMLALVEAHDRGFEVDPDLVPAQAEFTRSGFATKTESIRKGENVGGRAMTVGYALLALEVAGQEPDAVTDALASYLLATQDAKGAWTTQSHRPPLEESNLACTAFAIHALRRYAPASRKAEAEQAIARGLEWAGQTKPASQEDHVARLWMLSEAKAEPDEIARARRAVLDRQRDDGGWAADKDLGSDAYATGQTLYVLTLTGLATTDPAYVRGVRFLLAEQCDDGSWFVETRSKPIQVFFDNGDPHGKNQFIAIPATSWAVAALARALPLP